MSDRYPILKGGVYVVLFKETPKVEKGEGRREARVQSADALSDTLAQAGNSSCV